MKAIVVRETGGPEVLRYEDIPEPPVGDNDVLIAVQACGVCLHDVVGRSGIMKYGVSLPIVPGHEVAGTVVAVGRNVSMLNVGDRVATVSQRYTCGTCRQCRLARENLCEKKVVLGDAGLNGGYAERVAVDQRGVAVVPSEVDLESASIAGCAVACQLNAVRDVAAVRPGDEVLVTGASGGIGIHGVQLARNAGGHVIAVTSSATRASEIAKLGAHEVIVIERGEDFSRRVREAAGGRGVDVVIDNVGTPLFHFIRRSAAVGARWVLVGQVNGEKVDFNPAHLFLRGVSLLSATGMRKTQLEDAFRLMSRKEIKAVVDRVLPLERAAEAHTLVEERRPFGRIVLAPHT